MFRFCVVTLLINFCPSTADEIPRWLGLTVSVDRERDPDQGGRQMMLSPAWISSPWRSDGDVPTGGLEDCATECCSSQDVEAWQFSDNLKDPTGKDMSDCECATQMDTQTEQGSSKFVPPEDRSFKSDFLTVAGLCEGSFMNASALGLKTANYPWVSSMQCTNLLSKKPLFQRQHDEFCTVNFTDEFQALAGTESCGEWCATNANYLYSDEAFDDMIQDDACKDLRHPPYKISPFGLWSTYAYSKDEPSWDPKCDPRTGQNPLVLCWDCPHNLRPKTVEFKDCRNDYNLTGFQCIQRCKTMPSCKFVLIGANDDGNQQGPSTTLQPQFLYFMPGRNNSAILQQNLADYYVPVASNPCKAGETDEECCQSLIFKEFDKTFNLNHKVQMVATTGGATGRSYWWGSTSLLPEPKKSISVKVGTRYTKKSSALQQSSLGVELDGSGPYGCIDGGEFMVIGRDSTSKYGRLKLVGVNDVDAITFQFIDNALYNEADLHRCMSFNGKVNNVGMSESRAHFTECHSVNAENNRPHSHCFKGVNAPWGSERDYFTFNCPCYQAYLETNKSFKVATPPPDANLPDRHNHQFFGLGKGCENGGIIEIGFWDMETPNTVEYKNGKFSFGNDWSIVAPGSTPPATTQPPPELTEADGQQTCSLYRLDATAASSATAASAVIEEGTQQNRQQAGIPDAYPDYSEYSNKNCYLGHGAQGVDEDEGSNLYHGSKKNCMKGCANHDPPCTSITMGKNGECFRHTGPLNVGQCDASNYYKTYRILPNGTLGRAEKLNCYAVGHGVPDYINDLDAFPGNPKGHTLDECIHMCRDEANCTAITMGKNNDCYRHTGKITIGDCVSDGWYTTYIKKDFELCNQCQDLYYTCAKTKDYKTVIDPDCDREPDENSCKVSTTDSSTTAIYCAPFANYDAPSSMASWQFELKMDTTNIVVA